MQKEGGPLQVNQVRLGAVLSYVSMGLSTLISLIYTPIMLGRLGETEYGVYGAVGPIISYLLLLSMGLVGTMVSLAAPLQIRLMDIAHEAPSLAAASNHAAFNLANALGPWLAGMALANVLMPTLVRLHYPHRVGTATALYSLTLTLGVTMASAATVPTRSASSTT